MPPISVVISGRQKRRRATCRNLLAPEKGIRVVGEAAGGDEVIGAVAKLKPSILLLDAPMIGADAPALIVLIRRKSPGTRVLLLTDRPGARTVDTLCHGARGYLERATLRVHLARAVRVVASGEAWVPRKMVGTIMDRLTRLTVPA